MTSLTLDSVNALAARWAEIIWAVSWQFCVLGLIVLVVHWSLRRAAPNWRYWLWQILAIKLLLMPFWTATTPWKWSKSDSKVKAIAELPRREIPTVASSASPPNDSESRPRPSAVVAQENTQKSKVAKSSRSVIRQETEQKLASAPAKPPRDFVSSSSSEGPGNPGPRRNISDQSKTPGPLAKDTPLDRQHASARRPSVSPRQQSIKPATEADTPVVSSASLATLMTALAKTTGLGWQAWLMLGWILGVLLIGGRIVWQGFSLNRRLRQTESAEPALVQRVRDAAAQLGMTRIPDVRVIDLDVSPFVCGLWTIRLIIPRGLSVAFTAEQLDLVLLHELAHIRRRDLVWGWVPEAAKVFFFFHPLAHFLYYQIRFERELACDQLAMQSSGRDVATYADTLVKVVGQFSCPDSFRLAAADSPPN
jgi:beta-lactamase regulating signal transducer with metallopeptidase domain